ncbi:unnamed protein product [Cuscuta campestris]|uniref:Uncharacterized protein n=1 Tax=Cuscuta campestris TaxID=132261 RepID=A0A484NB94_9ASTE|nr:unnamed protein product [Cuscuta campestris]
MVVAGDGGRRRSERPADAQQLQLRWAASITALVYSICSSSSTMDRTTSPQQKEYILCLWENRVIIDMCVGRPVDLFYPARIPPFERSGPIKYQVYILSRMTCCGLLFDDKQIGPGARLMLHSPKNRVLNSPSDLLL